jgi:hypothetical protein
MRTASCGLLVILAALSACSLERAPRPSGSVRPFGDGESGMAADDDAVAQLEPRDAGSAAAPNPGEPASEENAAAGSSAPAPEPAADPTSEESEPPTDPSASPAVDAGVPPPDPAGPTSSGPAMVCESDGCAIACDGSESCDAECSTECKTRCRPGSSCESQCDGTEHCGVKCESGSDCTIACDAEHCEEIECLRGASCLLLCSSSEHCRFKKCEGTRAACPNGALVCGRACPP